MQTDVTAIGRSTTDETEPAPSARGRSGRVVLILLVLGYLAVMGWELWLGHPIGAPIGHTDEDSYLNAARAIARGPGGYSSESELFRRVGYPLFISLPSWLGLDFGDTYRTVQILNALLSAATLPLTYLLGRRMFRLGQWPALAAAVAAVTGPAVVFWSLIAMTDSIMAPLLLGWLLAIHWWLTSPTRKLAAVVAGTMTGVLFLVHIRGTILGLIFAVLVLMMLIRRRTTWLGVALSATPLVAAVVLNQVIVMLLGDKVRLLKNIVGGKTLDALTSGDRLLVLGAAVGTDIWYLCVMTAGLAGIGWAVTAAELWRPTRDAAFRWTATVGLASTFAVAFGSAVILAGLTSDNADALYTRYVEMFVPFWLLFGFAVLFDGSLRTALRSAVVPVLVLVGGGALIAYRLWYVKQQGHHLSYGLFSSPSLVAVTGGWVKFRVVYATVLGLVGLAVFIIGTRFRRLAIPVLVVLALANVAAMASLRHHVIVPLGAKYTPAVRLHDLGVGPSDRVALTWGQAVPMQFSLYHEVTWMTVKNTDVPAPDIDVMIARWIPGGPNDWDGTKFGFHRIGGVATQHWAVWRRN